MATIHTPAGEVTLLDHPLDERSPEFVGAAATELARQIHASMPGTRVVIILERDGNVALRDTYGRTPDGRRQVAKLLKDAREKVQSA